jgi:uncharacterized protein YceK
MPVRRRRRSHDRSWGIGPATGITAHGAVTLVFVVAMILAGCATTRSGSAAQPAASMVQAISPAPTTTTTERSTSSPGECAVTRPDPPFVPPTPAPASPPAVYGAGWYGSAHLWTMLDRGGELWRHLPKDAAGLGQKTFWWSADWVPGNEPEPAISVEGLRLDGPGSFASGPGTNATADFGTAMLVGVVVPTPGCWGLTARYRGASLSIVVSVAGD